MKWFIGIFVAFCSLSVAKLEGEFFRNVNFNKIEIGFNFIFVLSEIRIKVLIIKFNIFVRYR